MDSITLCQLACSDNYLKLIFQGVFPSDSMPNHVPKHSAFIINLDPKYLPGSHWIGVYFRNKTVHYFDSYGLKPSNKNILHFLHNHSSIIKYNDARLQNDFTTSCGLFCLFFLYHCTREKNMHSLSRTNREKNEKTVKKFVLNKFRLINCCKSHHLSPQRCQPLKRMMYAQKDHSKFKYVSK